MRIECHLSADSSPPVYLPATPTTEHTASHILDDVPADVFERYQAARIEFDLAQKAMSPYLIAAIAQRRSVR